MAKLTLNNVASFTNDTSAVTTTSANNDAIEAAMENTLSRDGTSPNTMGANLDMNSNRIINVAAPVSGSDAINKTYGDANYGSAAVTAAEAAQAAAEAAQTAAETAASNAETSETNAATSATNAATSASSASTSATNAATSASSASTSASSASTAATNAATSETNAETAETNAETAATNAATSETNAATSATNAATSATNAANSATSAATASMAFPFVFDSSTSMADPGTGEIRFNNSTIASVTAIAISNTFDAGSDISDFIATWDDSTHNPSSFLNIKKAGDVDFFAIFNVTGVTDNTTWLQITVTNQSTGGGTLSNGDDLFVASTLNGNDGAGAGDVSGPASSTDSHVALFDGTTGKLLKSSGTALGTISSQAANSVNITGGSITGITDLAIADGGTGASTASAAFDALKQAATETTTGVVELATVAEAEAGTDTTRAVTPSGVLASINANVSAGGVTLGTLQASTSGTAITFSSIPAGTKRIIVSFNNVSTNGTADFGIRIGDAGGIETTGYTSVATRLAPTTPSTQSSTSMFVIVDDWGATRTASGSIILTLMDAATFLWAASGNLSDTTNAQVYSSAGSKALSAELTQLDIYAGGTDTFDAGSINIMYE